MSITGEQIETFNKLMKIIKTGEENCFKNISINEKNIFIAVVEMKSYKSFLIELNNKIYGFINKVLSEEEREQELQILCSDKLEYYNDKEFKELKKLAVLKELKEMSFKSIKFKDLNVIIDNTTLREYFEIGDFEEKFNEFLNCEHDWICNDYRSKFLYMFKLGVMQGKREERHKRRKLVSESDTNQIRRKLI